MPKKPTSADAHLILQLYDIRREAEMRKARNWWMVTFWPETAEDILQREQSRALVRQCIDQLPEPYRVVVLLRDVEELPMNEVMEATGLSEPALKSRLHRARLALREALLPYLKGQDIQTS